MTGQDFEARLDPADEARLVRDIKAFPRELQKATTRRLRAAVQPMGKDIIAEVAGQLPRGGGLAYRVAGALSTVSTRTGARTAGVSLGFTKPKVLRSIEKGQIPHPVYARGPRSGWPWNNEQTIRAGIISEAFGRHERAARAAVEKALVDAAQSIHGGEAHR